MSNNLKVSSDGGTTWVTYGAGKTITGEKGDVLYIQLIDADGSQIAGTPDPALQFQGADSVTDVFDLTANSGHNFIVTLARNGKLVATTDTTGLHAEDAKTRLESHTYDLWTWWANTKEGPSGGDTYMMRYYNDNRLNDKKNQLGSRVGIGIWNGTRLDTNTTVNLYGNEDKEKEILVDWLYALIAADGGATQLGYDLKANGGDIMIDKDCLGARKITTVTGSGTDDDPIVYHLEREVEIFKTASGSKGATTGVKFNVKYTIVQNQATGTDVDNF